MDEEADDQKLQAQNLLAQLKEGSEYLENQREALSRLWEDFRGKVITFYETKPMKSVKKVNTTPTALCFLRISGAKCFASFVREDSRLTPKVGARIIRKGRRRSPNGAAIVCSALFA